MAEESNENMSEIAEQPTGDGDIGTENKGGDENDATDKKLVEETKDEDGLGSKNVEHEEDEGARSEDETGEEVQGEVAEGKEKEAQNDEEGKDQALGDGLGESEENVVIGKQEDEYGEEIDGEHKEDVEEEEKKTEEKQAEEEIVEEENEYVEEPPPDPAAPFDLSDSKEALKEPFELRPDQLAEIEQLWETFQDYTPAYSDIDNYITEKELVYMLQSLILLPFTPEQLQELIEYCVKPPDPNGHITYEQFLKIVRIRQRDFPAEDELRASLQVMDPDKTGSMDRQFLKDTLSLLGHKMPKKQLDNLIKEVDIANDGTIGVEDVVGTMCIDLNKEDLIMLRNAVYPPEPKVEEEEVPN